MLIQEEKLSQYTKLGKNVALITLGNFASKIMSFFLIPLYTAVLTTAEYGTADLMTTTINLLSPFFTLLISESVMRFALEQGKDEYSCAVTPQIRQTGNRLSGNAGTAYASLLA